jgi:uncharacterized protein (DUF433 family)
MRKELMQLSVKCGSGGLPGSLLEQVIHDLWHNKRSEHGLQPGVAVYKLDRIVSTPGVVSGKPRIKGTRVTVGTVLGQLAAGHTIEDVLRDYPYIQREDILEALQFAAWRAQEEEVELSA